MFDPAVEIVNQPARKEVRFRYEVEGDGRSARIKGCSNQDGDNSDVYIHYPAIKINNYQGPAQIIVSLVTVDDFTQHPHRLAGKPEDSFTKFKNGVCKKYVTVKRDDLIVFNNLRIQCVKRTHFAESLNERRSVLEKYPYRHGFFDLQNDIDTYRVKLCFQVFLESLPGVYNLPLEPAISSVICDKKIPDLVIKHLSRRSCYVSGGVEMILLCDKVSANDVTVVFYHNDIRWRVELENVELFKQSALIFKIPAYANLDIDRPVQVFIKLHSRSQGEDSKPYPFQYLPVSQLNLLWSHWPKRMRSTTGHNTDEYRILSEVLFDTVEYLNNNNSKPESTRTSTVTSPLPSSICKPKRRTRFSKYQEKHQPCSPVSQTQTSSSTMNSGFINSVDSSANYYKPTFSSYFKQDLYECQKLKLNIPMEAATSSIVGENKLELPHTDNKQPEEKNTSSIAAYHEAFLTLEKPSTLLRLHTDEDSGSSSYSASTSASEVRDHPQVEVENSFSLLDESDDTRLDTAELNKAMCKVDLEKDLKNLSGNLEDLNH